MKDLNRNLKDLYRNLKDLNRNLEDLNRNMKDLNRNLEDLNRNMKDPLGSCFRSPANIVLLHYGIILKDPLRFLKDH